MTIEKLLSDTYEKYTEISPIRVAEKWFNFKPASDKKIASFEADLGFELLPDLKKFYQHCGYEWSCDGNYSFSGLKQIHDRWKMLRTSLEEFMHEPEWVARAQPSGGKLKPAYWNPKWIPFAIDGCGNLICVDHDPGENGVLGQLVFMELQDGQGPFVDERDLSAFLASQLQLINDGKYEVEEEGYFEISQYF